MNINKAIFRAYDIRGSSLSDISPIIAYKIGFCFAKMNIKDAKNNKPLSKLAYAQGFEGDTEHSTRAYSSVREGTSTGSTYKSPAEVEFGKRSNKICVGRDGRLSSPLLYEWLVRGLIDAGASVVSIGVAPTPVLYFADKKYKAAASIMITGSHNPKDDNGFKMLVDGKSFFGQQIQDLMEEVIALSMSSPRRRGSRKPCSISGVLELDPRLRGDDIGDEDDTENTATNITPEYIARILEGISINPKLKVAWDPGNGAAGKITETLKARLPNNNIVINSTIDGNFPSHPPDPTILENLSELLEIVKSQNCDIGIAFDGDADRIGIITKSGRMLLGDQILCLFAKDIIATNPNATIIMDVKTSQVVFDQIELYGGKPVMWKTGHSFIKTKMLETNALLAGEMSGHIFFADKYYGYDDGIYAAIRFLDLLSRSKKSLDSMIAELPKSYATPEIKILVPDTDKFKIIEQIKQHLVNDGIIFIDIDGIRANTPHGWWLLRASNTSAAIIARCESPTPEGLEILKAELSRLIDDFIMPCGPKRLPCHPEQSEGSHEA